MLNKIGLSIQTMFADLIQRSHDAAFDRDFAVNGSFYRKRVKGKSYWYYNGYAPDGKRYVKYVGPDSDLEIASRIENFHSIKTDFNDRRKAVRALVAAGLPQPPAQVGKLIDALARAGIFRLRACLVGTTAFQTYSGVLGVRFPAQQLQTGDIDIAQFLSVAIEVEDSVPGILDCQSAFKIDPLSACKTDPFRAEFGLSRQSIGGTRAPTPRGLIAQAASVVGVACGPAWGTGEMSAF